ncbi:hypothetical protein [Kamptonema formosum]|uniref:hypothetical protein n=1 Tax=Kamptonema formosum TaxID=331992 RepID=UPI0012DE1034|nr:hypothetical protein [Oscillatoria sp. PCC 10802]
MRAKSGKIDRIETYLPEDRFEAIAPHSPSPAGNLSAGNGTPLNAAPSGFVKFICA